jgi:hypothetical protein
LRWYAAGEGPRLQCWLRVVLDKYVRSVLAGDTVKRLLADNGLDNPLVWPGRERVGAGGGCHCVFIPSHVIGECHRVACGVEPRCTHRRVVDYAGNVVCSRAWRQARGLGLAIGKTLALDRMEELSLAYDLAIYTAAGDRSRAVDRYARSAAS